MDTANPQPQVSRVDALILIGAGIVTAGQIGKAFVTIPLIVPDLQIGLHGASLILSIYSALGALLALPLGMLASRLLGSKRTLIVSLALTGIGGAIGAAASGLTMLVCGRAVEGIGALVTATAVPGLLYARIRDSDRDMFAALWGMSVPIGSGAMLVLGSTFPGLGWRAIWALNAVLPLAYALICLLRFGWDDRAVRFGADVVRATRTPILVLLAVSFGLYSFLYISVVGFMPLLLVSNSGLSVSSAGFFTTVAVLANAVGNACSGASMRWGAPPWLNIAITFSFFAAAALCIFNPASTGVMIAALSACAAGIGGLTPGSIFAAVGRLSPSPAVTVATIGLIQQMICLGQFLGPLATGHWAETYGWPAVPIVLVPVALLGLASSFFIRKLTHQHYAQA